MNQAPEHFSPYEERLTFVIPSGFPSLLHHSPHFWEEVATAAGATVLLSAHTAHVRHFVLSTSSLLVFSHSVILLTCAPVGVGAALRMMLQLLPPPLSITVEKRFPPDLPQQHPLNADTRALLFQLTDSGALALRLDERQAPCAHTYHLTSRRLTADTPHLTILFFSPTPLSLRTLGHSLAALTSPTSPPSLLEYTFPDGGYSLNLVWDDRSFLTLHSTPGAYLSADISTPAPLRHTLLTHLTTTITSSSHYLLSTIPDDLARTPPATQ